MATLEEERKKRQELRQQLDELTTLEPENLVREDELGAPLSFSEGLPVFKRTIRLFRDLADCDLEAVPHSKLNAALSATQNALTRLQQIQSFDPEEQSGSPFDARDNLIKQLQDQYDSYWDSAVEIITYTKQQAMDFDRLEREARGTLSTLEDSSEDFEATKEKAVGEINEALKQVREAAAEAGVSQQSIHFSNEADDQRTESRYWLGGTVFFAIVIFIYVVWFLGPGLVNLGPEPEVGRIISATLTKVAILSLLAFGLVWSARNFTRTRHNVVVNRHRSNALSTFNTFVSATSDPQVKDTVLVEATRSIFAPQASGYTDGSHQPQPRSRVVEVLSRLAGATEP